jgi:hypothetical protein
MLAAQPNFSSGTRTSPSPTQPASADRAQSREDAVLDGVLGTSSDPSSVLTSLYKNHEAGWRLRVSEPAGARRSKRSGAGQGGRLTVASLSTLLFQHGFVDTRVESHRGVLRATATRGSALPPAERPQRVSVVMPVYNERQTFKTVLQELLEKSVPMTEFEIIVVESNSSDGTREEVLALADDPRVTVILEDRAQGKGHAVRAGLARATGDIVLIQDADDEYDMGDYENLLEPLRTFRASFVLGSRNSHQGHWGMRHFDSQEHMSWMMNLGHLVFLALFNVVYAQRLRDPFTMYKVFRRDCLTDVHLECNRFDFDWELTAKLIRAGHEPLEVPVSYHSRSFADGKKITLVRDPITWIRACFKYRFGSIFDRPFGG